MKKVRVEFSQTYHLPQSTPGRPSFLLELKEFAGERLLQMVINPYIVLSILQETQGIKLPTPSTHDLIKNIIVEAGLIVYEVNIVKFVDDYFEATITIDRFEIGSPPGAAVAIALRFGVPIFVAEDVFEEHSFLEENVSEKEDPLTNRLSAKKDVPLLPIPPPQPMSELEKLKTELREAIKKEDFEKAASLRDEIKKLENS